MSRAWVWVRRGNLAVRILEEELGEILLDAIAGKPDRPLYERLPERRGHILGNSTRDQILQNFECVDVLNLSRDVALAEFKRRFGYDPTKE